MLHSRFFFIGIHLQHSLHARLQVKNIPEQPFAPRTQVTEEILTTANCNAVHIVIQPSEINCLVTQHLVDRELVPELEDKIGDYNVIIKYDST